jgi:predicted transcriptional regulator
MSEVALTVRQYEAVALVAAGRTPDEAAALLGVSVRTVRRYLSSDEVAAELRTAYRQRIAELFRETISAAPDAIRTLREITKDRSAAEHARVTAARAIMDHCQRLYDEVYVDERLDTIERRLDERDQLDRGRSS